MFFFFLSFHIGFIINLKVTWEQYYIWHQLNIIKKNPCMHRHVDSPRFVKAAYARLFNHQKLPFRTVFRRSNPLHDVVTCWPDTSLVWYEQPYPLIFFSLSLSLFPPRTQCQSLQKLRPPLQFILPSHLILILFITIFLFLISYKITNVLQFHHIIFLSINNLSNYKYCFYFTLTIF